MVADLWVVIDGCVEVTRWCSRSLMALTSKPLPDPAWRFVIWRPAIVAVGDCPHFAQQRRIPFTRPVTITIIEEAGRHVEREADHGAHGHRGGREIGLGQPGRWR